MNYLDDVGAKVRGHIDPEVIPDGNVDQLFRLYALLALTVGTRTRGEDVHHAWVVWMSDIDPTHPSLVPFQQLDEITQNGDEPFVQAVREVAQILDTGLGTS